MSGGQGRAPRTWMAPLAILALALVIRSLYLFHINLDADMAVTGLMGRHILQGHFPVFFYGQPFCGSIEAYLAAAIFALLGSSPLTLSLAPTLVGLTFVLVTYLAAKDMWGRQAGLWAMLFAALPPYYFVLHNVLPRAAYIEIPLFSLLLVWMAYRLAHRQPRWWLYLLYGLTAGVGFWTHFLIAYALMASAVYMVLAEWRLLGRRGHALIWAGFLVGSLPLWLYNLAHDWGTFTFLMQPKESVPPWRVLASLLEMGAPILLGAFKDGTQQAVVPVASYGVYALGLAGLGWLLWQRRRALGGLLRLDARQADGSELFLLVILAGVAITMLKGEPVTASRRHYVPLYAALIPLAGYALARLGQRRRALALGLGALALASNLAGVALTNGVSNPQVRRDAQAQVEERRQITETLIQRGVTRAYSLDYWNCPLITFESGERLLLVMPQDEMDHFHEPNARQVAQAGYTAYLARRDSHGIHHMLKAMGAKFNMVQQGGWTAFLDIRPPAAGLAEVPAVGWRASASHLAADLAYALDGDALTRWSPLEPQRPGQTLELDLGQVVPDLCLVRLSSGRMDDHPACTQVYVSLDGASWTRVAKQGTVDWPFVWSAGRALTAPGNARMDLGFTPRPARHLRVTQTCTQNLNYWSVQEISLYRAAPPGPPPQPQAVVDFALAQGTRRLYADESLRGFVPTGLRPLPQPPPRSATWPLAILPEQVLPGDLTEVMVAVEAHDAPRLAGFLGQRGFSFQEARVGGYGLFWRLRPPQTKGRQVPLAGASLRSSHQGGEVRLLDGNPRTAWDSGRPMQAGDFLEIGLASAHRLTALVLDNRANPRELPRGLTLALSEDGKLWREVAYRQEPLGPLVFGGDRLMSANQGRLRLSFAASPARFLRLVLNQGHPKVRWSIYELGLEEEMPEAAKPQAASEANS